VEGRNGGRKAAQGAGGLRAAFAFAAAFLSFPFIRVGLESESGTQLAHLDWVRSTRPADKTKRTRDDLVSDRPSSRRPSES